MKIAVLIPTRNNRPELLDNCLRMIEAQTLKPNHIEIVNDSPILEKCDITWRYRIGYDRLRKKGFDAILLMEDDDYYSPNYIETMVHEWEKQGKPEIFGTDYTIYYHIKLFAWFTFYHSVRSSAMSTLIKPDLKIDWPNDSEPYTDLYLWRQLQFGVFKPKNHICLGIKHGTTMTGGQSHVDRLHRYIENDSSKKFLRSVMDDASFNFYSNFIK